MKFLELQLQSDHVSSSLNGEMTLFLRAKCKKCNSYRHEHVSTFEYVNMLLFSPKLIDKNIISTNILITFICALIRTSRVFVFLLLSIPKNEPSKHCASET